MIEYRFQPATVMGISKVCPVCKKEFMMYDPQSHAYKITHKSNSYAVCSWKCVREYERTHEDKHEIRRKELIQRQLQGVQEGY